MFKSLVLSFSLVEFNMLIESSSVVEFLATLGLVTDHVLAALLLVILYVSLKLIIVVE